MADWNFKQLIGFLFMCVGGAFAFIGSLILLFTMLKPAVAITILVGSMLLSGIWLWKSGLKENDKKD